MDIRKTVLLTLPGIIVLLLALCGLVVFILNSANTGAVEEVPAEQQETSAPAAAETEAAEAASAGASEATPAETTPAKPTIIYQNEE